MNKGQTIARKTRPGPGVPAMNVFGEEIAPRPGEWIPFPAGPGTEISEDDERLSCIPHHNADILNACLCRHGRQGCWMISVSKKMGVIATVYE
ncbi:MAG: FapA family protein [Deltaproteobacteria bacterium]